MRTPVIWVGRELYKAAVRNLERKGRRLLANGANPEAVARQLHFERRRIGKLFKVLSPAAKRAEIRERNIERYGDELGPSVEWLLAHGKSWQDIIGSASRTGGSDLGFEMDMPLQKRSVLGNEYDADLRSALEKALEKLHAADFKNSWGVAGSQELETIQVEIEGQPITIESETYIGLSIEGEAKLVDRISELVAQMRDRGAVRA